MTQVELVLDAGAELAEGPCWLPELERLSWVDINAGRVHLFDPSTGRDRAIEIGEPVGAAVPAEGGRLALAVRHGFALLDLTSGRIEVLAVVEAHLPANRMNDGKCDRAGRFRAGTMATNGRRGAGALYRLDRDRRRSGSLAASSAAGPASPDCRQTATVSTSRPYSTRTSADPEPVSDTGAITTRTP